MRYPIGTSVPVCGSTRELEELGRHWGVISATVSRGFSAHCILFSLESAAVQHVNDDFPSFSDDAYL